MLMRPTGPGGERQRRQLMLQRTNAAYEVLRAQSSEWGEELENADLGCHLGDDLDGEE